MSHATRPVLRSRKAADDRFCQLRYARGMSMDVEETWVAPPPQPEGTTRGLAVAAALATFWISAAIGCVAARRWRRAAFWLITDWAWVVVFVAAVDGGYPRLFWTGFLAFTAWRIPAAIDAYRV